MDSPAPHPDSDDRRSRIDEAFARLGLGPHASVEEVRSAFRKRVMTSHPDQNPDAPADSFLVLYAAYQEALEEAARMPRPAGHERDPRVKAYTDRGRQSSRQWVV